jgi:hypothetical protein
MKALTRRMAVIGVAVAGVALAAAGFAAAANTPSKLTSATATGQASAQSQPGRTGGNGETPLTGGTVERVSNDTDGVSGAV